MDIFALKAFKDNYIWLFVDTNNQLCVIDPGDANPVLQWCATNKIPLGTILITHHHWDHTDGIAQCIAQYPGVKIYGPKEALSKGVQVVVNTHDTVKVGRETFKILEIPGHTLGHIAYYNQSVLFCGDTLFSGGCGRLFEGTSEQMANSLKMLCDLPESTLVFPAHEYTLANLQFAKTIEPDNEAMRLFEKEAQRKRQADEPTLPSTLKKEKQINPFLRCHLPSYRKLFPNVSSASAVFAELRAQKDRF